MPWVETIVGALLQVTFDRLASVLQNYASQWVVESDLKGMKKVVQKLLAVISDAEAKQSKNKLVRMWLEELKDVVYDAEDVLDLIENQKSSTQEKIKTDIENIIKRFEEIAEEMNNLKLAEGTLGTSTIVTMEPRFSTSSLVIEHPIYGRDKDVEEMIELLLSEKPCDKTVGVIPIVGPGGIGKTTLAQELYNHPRVEEHFELKAWVCVSDVFDVNRVTKVIIESANGNPCGLQELSLLHDKLKGTLKENKFLLVLDDVWTNKYEDWIALSTPFRAGAKGSRVIITTRSESVSSITGTVRPHHLKLLSDDDCFLLFKQHAFSIQNSDAQQDLEGIGKGIARKCKGLPLAAKALGGILRSKRKEGDWEDVLRSEIWDLLDQETELGPALWLSYYNLPAHLKRCFVYCGIFPKDYSFDKEKLIRLWMAEGFVGQKQNLKTKKRMEDVGDEYFCDLVSRSIFQQCSEDNSKFIMHDLINDLARAASGEMCFTMDDEEQLEKQISEKTRHLSYWKHKYEAMKRFERASKLRTFISFRDGLQTLQPLPIEVPHDLLSKLVCLRVLSLRNYKNIIELPESIGNLVLLRFLDLSSTSIIGLPESINALYNLQMLLLRECWKLKELPRYMGNLVNLRYLDIEGCNGLQNMSRGVGKSKELQMLPRFIVDEDNGAGIQELTDLEHLRGSLEISGLETIRNPVRKKIDLINKQHLQTLKLVWNKSKCHSQVKSDAEHVLERLKPHANLKGLVVIGYYGTSFSSWLKDPSCCSNLVKLSLLNCENCESLPPLGKLPFLKELSMSGMGQWEEWTRVGQESEQEFPSLQNLKIAYCWKLKTVSGCFPALVELDLSDCKELTAFSQYNPGMPEWDTIEREGEQAFPCLQHLKIQRCPKLTTVSNCFPALVKLEIECCEELTAFPRQLNEVVGGVLRRDHLTSLQRLVIGSCGKLEMLSDGLHNLSSLQELTVKNCPAIGSFLEEKEFPTMLKRICITDCENLKCLPGGLHNLLSLEKLDVCGCPRLHNVTSLRSRADQSRSLASLRSLRVTNCQSFPQGICPDNVQSLTISIDENTSLPLSPSEFNLSTFTSLQRLTIKGREDIASLPECLLPNTLTSLTIWEFPHLEALPNGMQHLTSLEFLSIHNCPKLALSLDQELPTTLCHLDINRCPLLEQWCKKKIEEGSSILAKNIVIDGKFFTDRA